MWDLHAAVVPSVPPARESVLIFTGGCANFAGMDSAPTSFLRWFATVAFVWAVAPAFPAPQVLPFALDTYVTSQWHVGESVPVGELRAIAQTGDGFVWIAPAQGLLRFDGVQFDLFDERTVPAFPGAPVSALGVDSSGRLWIGFQSGGVRVFERGEFHSPLEKGLLDSSEIYSITVGTTGTVFVSTKKGTIRVNGSRGEFLAGLPEVPRFGLVTPEGDLLLSSVRIVRWRDGHRPEVIFDERGHGNLTALVPETDSTFLAGSANALLRLRIGADGRLQVSDAYPTSQVQTLLAEGGGQYLMGTHGDGFFRFDGSQIFFPSQLRSVLGTDRQVRALFRDRQSGIWAATSGTLYRFRRSPVHLAGMGRGRAEGRTWIVHRTSDGTVWMGGGIKGVHRLGKGVSSAYTEKHGLPDQFITAILQSTDGAVWFGGRNGRMVTFDGKRFTPLNVPSPPRHGPVISLCEHSQYGMLVGTARGLYRVPRGRRILEPFVLNDSLRSVRSIQTAADGSIWFVASARACRWNNGAVTTFAPWADTKRSGVVTLLVDSTRIWLGTPGKGLFLLEGDSIIQIRARELDPGPHVMSIHKDTAGNLWINAVRQIQRLTVAEVLAWRDRRTKLPRLWKYDQYDGLRDVELAQISEHSSQEVEGGLLLFASSRGIVVLDPATATFPQPPLPVAIREVLADGIPLSHNGGVEIPEGTQRVEIRYSALAFDVPSRVRFQFRLSGVDKDWVLREGTERSISYTNLEPGSYTFTLNAWDTGSDWEPYTASLHMVLAPAVHQTWWFRIAAVAAVIGVALGGHRLRMRTVRERARILEKEVDQRRRAEAALRESEGKYRALFESAYDAIFLMRDDRFIDCNLPAATMFGYTVEEFRRLGPVDVSPPHQPDGRPSTTAAREWIDAAKNGAPQFFEWEHVRRDGSRFLTEVSLKRVLVADEWLLLAIVRDVTARRRSEEQLRESLAEKTVMLKEIHHRVKNNLQVISSLLSLQTDASQDPTLRSALSESRERIRTMALIHETLYGSSNLARIEFGEYLRKLAHHLQRSYQTSGIDISVQSDAVSLSVEQAIPAALMTNELITNAFKHAYPAGRRGTISVTLYDQGEEWTELAVRDDGVGLPEGFDPGTTASLGMQLVHTLTYQLEGQLSHRSEQGARFSIRFRRT